MYVSQGSQPELVESLDILIHLMLDVVASWGYLQGVSAQCMCVCVCVWGGGGGGGGGGQLF